jgi:hypothetical protein
MKMEASIGKEYLSTAIEEFRKLKNLAEKAMAQLEPSEDSTRLKAEASL